MDWTVARTCGRAEPFHQQPLPARPEIWVHRIDRPALVLGSSQPDDIVDRASARRLGVEICRRRSGGGLVYVDPEASRWVDVVIPAGHRRWEADVHRAFLWIGHAWRSALAADGVASRVHDGPTLERDHGRFLCFAGVGPGEVTAGESADPSKTVGLSQRRTREAARIQCLLLSAWDPDAYRRLVVPEAWPRGLRPERVVAGWPVDADAVERAFIAQIVGRSPRHAD